ncbi:MAG: hypothetical protein K8M05_42335, partial [Deltaproteobacteria bacterium]|nr:hypothetical protein [Kofleriaceae bacterium]
SPPALASDAARLVARSTTLTWTRDGGVDTVAGTLDGAITIAGATATVAGQIAVAGKDRTFSLSGAADLSVKNLFGLTRVDLRRVALTSTVTTTGGTTAAAIGLELGLSVEGTAFTGALSTLVAGGAVQELEVGLKGKVRLRALEQATGEALTLVDPSIGYLPRTREGFVGGGVSWKRQRANAVLYARAGGVLAAFLELERVDLAKIVGATSLPLGTVDRVIAVLSTAAMSEVPIADLPSPAREMLGRLGVATGGAIRPTAGLTVMAKLPLATIGQPLGLATDIVVAGSVGVEGGKPVFALYGDLPAFAVPPGVHGVKLPSSAAARLFLALRGGGELQLGVDVGLRFALEARRELEASGSIYVALGSTGGAVTVTGALRNDWVDPFGLAGITFKGAALTMSGASDGSVRVMMKGSAAFGGNTLALGGGVSLLLSTGVPTVKGFALRFGADELAPTTPLALSQVVIRAAAAAIDRRGLPKPVADGLAIAARVDLVSTFGAALPTSRLARFDRSLALQKATLYVATPGMGTDPEFGEFADAGVQVKGTLMLGTTALGAVDLYATVLRGFQLAGKVSDVKLSQLEVRGASIDIGAGIPGLQAAPPRFEIRGTGELDGKNLAVVDVAINEDEVRIAGSVAVFGARVNIQGAMTKPKTFELTGTATLDIPKAGRVAGVEVSFDSDDGVRLEARVGYHGARFTVKGKYRSASNWSLSGKLDVDTSKTIELATGDVKVKIKGDAKLKLENEGGGAKMSARMKGTAKATVAGAPVSVDLDEKINSDLKITFDFLLKKVTVKVL